MIKGGFAVFFHVSVFYSSCIMVKYICIHIRKEELMIAYQRLQSNDNVWLKRIVKTFRQQELTDEKAREILQNKRIRIWMASEEEHVCGYVLAYVLPRIDMGDDMLMIYHCFVHENYQRRHIAEEMMRKVIDDARKSGMHYTFLITQEDNSPANALYQKLGGHLHEENKNVYYWYGTGKPKL